MAEGYTETFALYMVLCERRDQLISYLHNNEIEAKIHYPLALHQQRLLNQGANLIPTHLQQPIRLITDHATCSSVSDETHEFHG